jgi:hypothetical protein
MARTEPSISYRWQRYHSALQTGPYLSVKSKQRSENVSVFFAQGSLDGACGLHVFCAVLVIFDLAKHDALEDMSRRRYGVPAEVFAAFQHTFFTGVHAADFVELVNTQLKLPLKLTLRQAVDGGLDKWTVDCLMRGELLAVTFASVNNRRTKHWALCCGIEGSASGRETKPDQILLIDPAAGDACYRTHNARLRLPQTGPGSRGGKAAAELHESKSSKPIDWLYESPDWGGTEPMRLLAAVRFRLTDRP